MCIPKNSKHKDWAEMYINFMCETDIALSNVQQTGYSTPQKETYDKLDDSIKKNKIFYPDDEVINNSQIFINLPDDINKLLDELWIEVKSGCTNNNAWILVLILFIFVIIYVFVFLYKKIKNKKRYEDIK